MSAIIRRDCATELLAASKEYPIVTVFGPRQSGKTTLVRSAFPNHSYRLLEEPDTRLLAQTDPRGFLAEIAEGAILDEIQRAPELLSYLQGVVDADGRPGRFVLTGSHQPELHRAISQSLAGRTAVLTLLPLSIHELRSIRALPKDPFEMAVRGGFPRLHAANLSHERFFSAYLQTYLERDVRALINVKDLRRFQQFLVLLAGRVGQLVNYMSLANDIGVSATTIKDWISALMASFVVFELASFHENLSKRVVKAPKLYFTDVGLAAHLAGIRTPEQAARDPLRGGLYENLVIGDLLKGHLNRGRNAADFFFYRDSHGNEVDLLVRMGRTLAPVEIKSSATFHPDFLKGIERFQTTVGQRALPGMLFFNGAGPLTCRNVRVANPLDLDDLYLHCLGAS